MNITDLKPASQLFKRFGVKTVVYGPPGTGKTPLIQTAPRPVLLVCEPGLLSMRSSNVPCFEAYTIEKIDEFFKWLHESKEASNFDTVGVDSISQMAEIYTKHFLKSMKHGEAAYGEMSRTMMKHLEKLFHMPQKHTYLIAKQAVFKVGEVQWLRPYFPGQDLNVKVPHLFDEILHLDNVFVPGNSTKVKAFRTFCGPSTTGIMCRDRSGNLSELEQPDLSYIFNKCMQ